MTSQKQIRGSATILGAMLVLTVVQSYTIAQLDFAHAVRSILAVFGGAIQGQVASLIWIFWLGREEAKPYRE